MVKVQLSAVVGGKEVGLAYLGKPLCLLASLVSLPNARFDCVWEKDLKKSGHFTAMSGENKSLCSVPSLPLSPASLLLRPGLTLSPG